MASHRLVAIVCVAVLLGSLITSPASAVTSPNRVSYFTFKVPVRLPGKVLPPGTYVFELQGPESANVVHVMDRTRSKAHVIALTQPVERSKEAGLQAVIVFGERQAPRPITAWYPAGERTGRAFIYQYE